MNRIDFVIKGRGLKNAMQRVKSIHRRFGLDPLHFIKKIEDFCHLTASYDVRPSFPISTILLERYPSVAEKLAELPLDLLSHGYTHIDHAKISSEEQHALIARSRSILSAAGFKIDGFRAPYLRWNETLLDVVFKNGFSFDSSVVRWSPAASGLELSDAQQITYDRAYRFYAPYLGHPENGALPYFLANGLLEIPVTVPDDEILIDRLGVTGSQLSETLLAIWEDTHKSGGLFNLQLHPERTIEMAGPLEVLLKKTRAPSSLVWVATLREINQWWRERRKEIWPHGCRSALCITGDIDCLTITDFARRFTEGWVN